MNSFSRKQREFRQKLEEALALDHRYLSPELERAAKGLLSILGHPLKEPLKRASVLVLWGFSKTGEAALLYTKRTEGVETHKGQMAFPGGYCEPSDHETPFLTALRETEEEVGILHDEVQVIGELPSLPTVSGFLIQPVVGMLKGPIEQVRFKLSRDEIAEAFWVPWPLLTDPTTYRLEIQPIQGQRFPIHVYQVKHYRIWGATGAITKNLLDRLEQQSCSRG